MLSGWGLDALAMGVWGPEVWFRFEGIWIVVGWLLIGHAVGDLDDV